MKDDRVYIEHMLTCIQKVEGFVSGDNESTDKSSLQVGLSKIRLWREERNPTTPRAVSEK
ncbi:MAG: hypothetical protein Q7J27_13160 [Syntrophales bacterium]|nr:hypothetical protein [Syntrophales bacterium]